MLQYPAMLIKKIRARSILSRSGIPGADYCINPYVGCSHGCRYCYATFMKKFTGHTEPWGSFVDIKLNAPEELRRQLRKAEKGTTLISSVTDPYQPIEKRCELTRQCLETLLEYQFPVDILTKSPLVLRDSDLFTQFKDIDVGITITTDSERIRKVFEPNAPSIKTRINALKNLHEKGIRTYVFIGPALPMDPEKLSREIFLYADRILIDRMNYTGKTQRLYRQMHLTEWLDHDFITDIITRLEEGLKGKEVCNCSS
jgi:DNA repair photolyase